MAGLGFKDFQVGEVLTSSDVDGYLMQQSVMRFADAGARGSALGTASGTGVALAEGMVSYLDDTDTLSVYDGSQWRGVGRVLQVVTATDSTQRTTTSSSFTDASISVSITPLNASSTLYVEWSATFAVGISGPSAYGEFQITDSSNTALEGAEASRLYLGTAGPTIVESEVPGIIIGKVASASTATRTYKGRFRNAFSTTSVKLRNANATGRLRVWEIL